MFGKNKSNPNPNPSVRHTFAIVSLPACALFGVMMVAGSASECVQLDDDYSTIINFIENSTDTNNDSLVQAKDIYLSNISDAVDDGIVYDNGLYKYSCSVPNTKLKLGL